MSADSEATAPGSNPVLLALLGVATFVALIFIVSLAWFFGRQQPPLPVLSEIPEFSLINRDGSVVTHEDFTGELWVADFIFTRCIAICPRMTQQMRDVSQLLPDTVRLASISVDPEYDTPEVLAEYARRHGAADDWYFLTGETAVIDDLAIKAFLLPLDRSPPPELLTGPDPIIHSNRFALVDGQARIRGYYDAFDPAEMERLVKDVGRLMKEHRR